MSGEGSPHKLKKRVGFRTALTAQVLGYKDRAEWKVCATSSCSLNDDIKHTALKNRAVDFLFRHCDRIFRTIHRIGLLGIALKVNLRNQRQIAWTNCNQVKMSATPELRGIFGIRSIG